MKRDQAMRAWEAGVKALEQAKQYRTPQPPESKLLLAVAHEEGECAMESVAAIYKDGTRYFVYIAGCDVTGWDVDSPASLETYDSPGKAVAAVDDELRPLLVWADQL